MDKERITELQSLLAYRRMHEKYRYYVPNGRAEEFIRLVGQNQNFISLFSAANGVGKTAVGVNILANIFYESAEVEYENKYYKFFNDELYEKFPYPKRGRIITEPTTIATTLIPELYKWFPTGRFTTNKMGKNYEYFFTTDTGFEFDIMSYDQNVKEFESATLGWAWFDEPPPEAIFKATVARMRTGGIIFITATPLTGSAWMYDHIMTDPKQGQRQYIEADVWANSVSKGIRGRLTDEAINRMIEEYSEEDKQARIFGKFQHLTGLVFKAFSRNIHVIDPFNINLEDYAVYERLDPHPRNPDAVLWLAIDRKGTKFVIDELFENATTGQLAMLIKQRASNYRIIDRRIDPSAFIVDSHTNKSLSKELVSLGLDYLPATKSRTLAIKRIEESLDYRESVGEITKKPELFVFSNCKRVIWEFEHWQYHEYSGRTAEYRDKSDKPQDKDDHMMENLGRALLENQGFIEMPKHQYQRVIDQSIPILDPFYR